MTVKSKKGDVGLNDPASGMPQPSLSLVQLASPFHDLPKHANYLSDFGEDRIRYQAKVGHVFKYRAICLSDYLVPPSKVHPHARRFTEVRAIADISKALINIILSKNNSLLRPVLALGHLEMLVTWGHDREIYRLQDFTREHTEQFLRDVAKGRGVASGIHKRLRRFLSRFQAEPRNPSLQTELKAFLVYRKVSKKDKGYTFKLSMLEDAIGMRIGQHLPRWFIQETGKLLRIKEEEFKIQGYEIEPQVCGTVSRYAETLNLLASLPAGFDTLKFYPFPDTTIEGMLKYGAAPEGRTDNLPLDTAISIMAAAAQWVVHYHEAFLMLGRFAREQLIQYQGKSTYYHAHRKLPEQLQRIKDEIGVDLEAVIGRRIGHFGIVVEALALLVTACLVVIYSNTARRKNEIVSDVYGLTYGCLRRSALGEYSMRVYIEKSLRRYVTKRINVLTGKAIEILQAMQEIYAGLDSGGQVADDQSLFKDRLSFTMKSFSSEFSGYKVTDWMPRWLGIVVGRGVEVRVHMWRRFYAVLFFYRYEYPQLSALSAQLCHVDQGETFTYITDVKSTELADSIDQTMRLKEYEVDGQAVSVIEEFDPEFIKTFKSVEQQFVTHQIVKAATGAEMSGGFARVLLGRVKDYVDKLQKGAELLTEDRFAPLAKKLIGEGHKPTPMPHGICFARKDGSYGANEAHCAKDGKIDASKASCNVCGTCPNHLTHVGTMAFLDGEIAHFNDILEDFSRSPFEQSRARQELARLKQMRAHHLAEFKWFKKAARELAPENGKQPTGGEHEGCEK